MSHIRGGSRGDQSDHATKVKFPKNARKVNWKKSRCETTFSALHRSSQSSIKISSRPRPSNMIGQKAVLRMSFARYVTQFQRSDWLFRFLLVLRGVLIVREIRGNKTAYIIGSFKKFPHSHWLNFSDRSWSFGLQCTSKGAWRSRLSALESDRSDRSLTVIVKKFIWTSRHRKICIWERQRRLLKNYSALT